jgi:hypothetical protein
MDLLEELSTAAVTARSLARRNYITAGTECPLTIKCLDAHLRRYTSRRTNSSAAFGKA